jgi:hypothetical protein
MRVGVKVRQQMLPTDVKSSLLKELSSRSAKKACLEFLEMSVSLLQETGGEAMLEVGDTLLSHFLSSDLQISDSDIRRRLGLNSAAASVFMNQVALKHILHLFNMLRESLVVAENQFEIVADKYKHPLDAGTAAEIRALFTSQEALKSNIGQICEVLRSYLLDTLQSDESTGSDKPIKEIIGYSYFGDDEVQELPWFEHFPMDLSMGNIVSVFKVLSPVAATLA